MERRGIDKPLLIGGATTSRQHTAVKIAPAFAGTTVHVLDASRAVGVVSTLLSYERRDAFAATNVAEQERLRETYAGAAARPLLSYAEARARRPALDFGPASLAKPASRPRALDGVDLAASRVIDWTSSSTPGS
jgi:5-methyltetrahydrofolate--homocysteine methyltransferase